MQVEEVNCQGMISLQATLQSKVEVEEVHLHSVERNLEADHAAAAAQIVSFALILCTRLVQKSLNVLLRVTRSHWVSSLHPLRRRQLLRRPACELRLSDSPDSCLRSK